MTLENQQDLKNTIENEAPNVEETEAMQPETKDVPQTLAVSGELINGVEYVKNTVTPAGKGVLKYLSGLLKQYRLSHRPLDTISDINAPLVIPGMDKTQLRPSLTMTVNGSSFPDWVIEVIHPDEAEMTYLMKTGIYAEAGVKEYWIVDPEAEALLVYVFDKNGFIPKIYDSPQRIRVTVYRDLFISYSEIFKAAK